MKFRPKLCYHKSSGRKWKSAALQYTTTDLNEWINSFPPEQNGRRFAYDIFRSIFVNEKICNLIEMSLKFVPKGSIDNNPALV